MLGARHAVQPACRAACLQPALRPYASVHTTTNDRAHPNAFAYVACTSGAKRSRLAAHTIVQAHARGRARVYTRALASSTATLHGGRREIACGRERIRENACTRTAAAHSGTCVCDRACAHHPYAHGLERREHEGDGDGGEPSGGEYERHAELEYRLQVAVEAEVAVAVGLGVESVGGAFAGSVGIALGDGGFGNHFVGVGDGSPNGVGCCTCAGGESKVATVAVAVAVLLQCCRQPWCSC
eukprot:6174862-Pleurochrysis_carterae.AAC.2